MNFNLDIKEMKNFLVDFYNISDFRIALFDTDFNEVLSYPTRLSTFCSLLRSDSKLNQKCRNCDFNSFSLCQSVKKTIIYECHAGLTEMIVPIKSSYNEVIGFIMCGQTFKTNSMFNTWDKLYDYLKDYSLDFESLKLNYNARSQTTDTKVQSIANIVTIATDQLYHMQKIYSNEESLQYKIDSYIMENIAHDLDVSKLCAKFGYQKTKFYEVTNKMYGVGIAKHIRQMRIQHAKKLLSNTSMTISEIATAVGIEDYNYFTKVFKDEAFCTPRDFRKNNFAKISHT